MGALVLGDNSFHTTVNLGLLRTALFFLGLMVGPRSEMYPSSLFDEATEIEETDVKVAPRKDKIASLSLFHAVPVEVQ